MSETSESLRVSCVCFDVGDICQASYASANEAVIATARSLSQRLDSSDDFVVLPEFVWASLACFFEGDEEAGFRRTSEFFWQEGISILESELATNERVLVLGTAPYWDDKIQVLFNRCPILFGRESFHQDKVALTPWESQFESGNGVKVFTRKGIRFAVAICLDVEMPEIAAQIKPLGIDLLLVPSATESEQGVRRIDRCASSRAVELGCAVATCHLRGQIGDIVDLVDENEGGSALHLPSQAEIAGFEVGGLASAQRGTEVATYKIPIASLRTARNSCATNPANIRLDSSKARPVLAN